jgi:hypothetical protein
LEARASEESMLIVHQSLAAGARYPDTRARLGGSGPCGGRSSQAAKGWQKRLQRSVPATCLW